jgi:hypothetical protein
MSEDNMVIFDQRTGTVVADPLWAPSVHAGRILPDGRCLRLMAMTYGKVRLTLSASLDAYDYLDGW